MMVVLLGLLAGLGVTSAQADAPILTGGGGRQTPHVANQTPGTLPSNATNAQLPSPSPIQTSTPLNPTASPSTSSSTTTPSNTDTTPTQSAEKTDNQTSHTVRFDPDDGSKPTQSTVKTGTFAAPPQQNPQREGFRFDGWTHDGQSFDFQTPILQDMTLKAKWTKTTDWTLSPDHGPASGTRLTISPPSRQEPYYASIHTIGNQTVGLTGDGHIYTWAQDSTTEQVSLPAHAADGFHYLQAAAGNRSQAALGTDQHIYTWTSQQAIPTILDTGPNTKFTSISMDNDRLLAVDQQGQVHAYQTSQADSQNTKPTEQATTSLPGQAQAITVAASDSQALIADADGHAWTWNTTIENSKPERVKQDPGMRTVQAQALNQGFLILDAKGQAWYLADNTTAVIQISLPDSAQVSRITANKDQAMIVDENGHIWAWKPGKTPASADNGKHHYTQAASIGNSIIAVDKQGGVFTWNLGEQDQPGQPARINTAQAPILESASMDGQSLKLSKKDDLWHAEIPTRQPGQTAILIAGKQDEQPFTRDLKYTVDQTLTRDASPKAGHSVSFNATGGDPTPDPQQILYPYGRVKRPTPNPTREGYQFDGWFIDNIAYDFSKPVTKDLILTAHWTSGTWTINPDKGSQLGEQTTTITPPPGQGIKFSQISGGKDYNTGFSLAVGSDGNAYAWGDNTFGQLGDGTTIQRTTPVMVKKPDHKTYPDLPADFTYVQVSAGGQHSLAVGSDGYAYAWGHNDSDQLGNNTSDNHSSIPVRVLDPDSPTNTSKGLKATQVSAGYNYSLAMDSDGYAYAWGHNGFGQLGNDSIPMGQFNSNAKCLVPVRVRDPDSPTDTSKGLKATQVSAGYDHSLATGNNGNTYAWGDNKYGQLGDGTTIQRATPVMAKIPDQKTYADLPGNFTYVQVSAGGDHSLAVGSDGHAYAWGYNYYGQLGSNTSDNHSSIPVRVRDPDSPTDTSKGLKATQVSGGQEHSLAVGSNGHAYAWGLNSYGQLGDNTRNNRTIPVKVFASNQSTSSADHRLNAVLMSGGWRHSLAISTDGNANTWGENRYGQLGDDSRNDSNVPVSVVFNLTPVIVGVRFDISSGANLTSSDGSSVSVLTPAHQPGTVTVSVDYTIGGAAQQPDASLKYTYLPAGVLPQAGGEGILLALATGMTGMGGVLASRRHRREQHQLLYASHE